jgi:hypothetical protein
VWNYPRVLDYELNVVFDVLESDRDVFQKILQAYGLSLRSCNATQVHARRRRRLGM